MQRLLSDNGLQLRALPSYQGDIASLNQHSSRTLKLLASHSYINVGKVGVGLNRGVADALLAQTAHDSVLLIGEPGVGKSGVVYDFARRSVANGHDVMVLSAEDLAAPNLNALRSELHLIHDTTDVLDNWPGTQPAFLVIDALDAARARERIFMRLAAGVPNHLAVTLDDLLVVRPDENVSGLQALKANRSKPSVDAMLALLDKLRVIEGTGALGVDLSWLNGNYQRALFHRVRKSSAARLHDLAEPRRRAALVCFLWQSYRDAVDQAVDMFDKLLTRAHTQAQQELDEQLSPASAIPSRFRWRPWGRSAGSFSTTPSPMANCGPALRSSAAR